VGGHTGLAIERPGVADREKLGHRLVSSPVEPASLLIGPRETGPRASARTAWLRRGPERSEDRKPLLALALGLG